VGTLYSLKVTFKGSTLEEFSDRYLIDVGPSGMFVRTPNPLSVGARVCFDFRLENGTSLLKGEGVVVWTAEENKALNLPSGMELRFDVLTPECNEKFQWLLMKKRGVTVGREIPLSLSVSADELPDRFPRAEPPSEAQPAPLAWSRAALPGPFGSFSEGSLTEPMDRDPGRLFHEVHLSSANIRISPEVSPGGQTLITRGRQKVPLPLWVGIGLAALLVIMVIVAFFTSQTSRSEIHLFSEPVGAEVIIDDKPVGITPLLVRIPLRTTKILLRPRLDPSKSNSPRSPKVEKLP
jgi:uncharacterized protein (TIGR02266 family)